MQMIKRKGEQTNQESLILACIELILNLLYDACIRTSLILICEIENNITKILKGSPANPIGRESSSENDDEKL